MSSALGRVRRAQNAPQRDPSANDYVTSRGLPCAYCGLPAANLDHVVPKALRKHVLYELPLALAGTVPACFACNMRKSTRKLVPPSWVNRIPALKDVLPGEWRVWRGDPHEPAFSGVHP